MKKIFKDIALYCVAFIVILAGAIILLTNEIEYSIYIKALIFSTAVWCGFKINSYREKIFNEDQIEQTPNQSYKNSCFIMKLSDKLILVDKNYVFDYIDFKRDGKKSTLCPFTFEEDGLFSEVRDLIDKEEEKKEE